jgi:hypothetical protein
VDREEWREVASDYIEGRLSDTDAARVRAFLAAEPDAAADEAALRAVWRGLDALPQHDPPLYFAENLQARLQAEQETARPWWARYGRVAFGTMAFAGMATVALWNVVVPHSGTPVAPLVRAGASSVDLPGAGIGADDNAQKAPRLRIARALRVVAEGDPVFDFQLTLENADRGRAEVTVPGDANRYTFALSRDAAQILRVPTTAARGASTLALRIDWTVGETARHKWVFVPVPVAGSVVPALRQSFGLGDLALPDAVRAVSERYNQPVTLEDAPADVSVMVVARNETAVQALQRHLVDRNLRVAESPAGILIAPKAESPATR